MRNPLSLCNKCENLPCRNGETITPNSHFLVSAQFKLEFAWDKENKIYIKKCSGYNRKDFYYEPAVRQDNNTLHEVN